MLTKSANPTKLCERRQPSQGLTQPSIETLGAYTTYMVAVCIGLRMGYGARVAVSVQVYPQLCAKNLCLNERS